MLSMNKKSYVMRHVMILWLFGALQKLQFRETLKKCLIDSIPQVELS